MKFANAKQHTKKIRAEQRAQERLVRKEARLERALGIWTKPTK